jgi:hypothetical protein
MASVSPAAPHRQRLVSRRYAWVSAVSRYFGRDLKRLRYRRRDLALARLALGAFVLLALALAYGAIT